MNRIDQLFLNRKSGVKAMYFTAGFPRLNSTMTLLETLEKEGAHLIEIGMPFSDPLADGPVIQRSSEQALENGMTLNVLFSQLNGMRNSVSLPVVLMGYYNPVRQYGVERFLDNCSRCGVDGVILPDLPMEVYREKYKALFDRYGIYPVFLITTRTPESRVRELAAESKGFVYLVSSTSVTGVKGEFSEDRTEQLGRTAKLCGDKPVLTGFGIHDARSFEQATRYTSGGIVGSALVRELESASSEAEAVMKMMNKLETRTYDRSIA